MPYSLSKLLYDDFHIIQLLKAGSYRPAMTVTNIFFNKDEGYDETDCRKERRTTRRALYPTPCLC